MNQKTEVEVPVMSVAAGGPNEVAAPQPQNMVLIKLISGESLLAPWPDLAQRCPYTDRTVWMLSRPLMMTMQPVQVRPGQVQMQVRLNTWLYDGDTPLVESCIAAVVEAPEDMARAYLQATTGIELPSAPTIQT